MYAQSYAGIIGWSLSRSTSFFYPKNPCAGPPSQSRFYPKNPRPCPVPILPHPPACIHGVYKSMPQAINCTALMVWLHCKNNLVNVTENM